MKKTTKKATKATKVTGDAVLDQYIVLDRQIKELEARKEAIKEFAIETVKSKIVGDEKTIQRGDYTFTLGCRKTYAYSQSIDDREKALAAAKKREVETGVAVLAKSTDFVSLNYKPEEGDKNKLPNLGTHK